MPFIEMYVTEGTLDEETKRRLHDRVSRQVLEVEGASYEDSEQPPRSATSSRTRRRRSAS